MPPVKRKTFPLKEKLKIVRQRKESNLSGRQFAISVGIEESTIRHWMKLEGKYEALQLKNAPLKKMRKVPRVIVKGYYPEIDEPVKQWLLERNRQGIRVKDSFIQEQAIRVRDDLLTTSEEALAARLRTFAASKIWCHRFKKRNNFVARRHTTSHTLPDQFREQAVSFVQSVQNLIAEHNIKREFIINLDQVPRYYETSGTSTIAQKGTREVLVSKTNGHKRFTFTPFITAAGKILIKHVLLSKVKRIPKHHSQCCVSVNQTGMWNMAILTQHIDEAIRLARGLFLHNESILFLLDSYPVHIKFVQNEAERYEHNKVYFAIIPKRLTGLLQPLDVAVNRSFQQFYNDRTQEYRASAITNKTNLTAQGNIQMPSCELITGWVVKWSEQMPSDQIKKAFDLCGLVPTSDFSHDKLHTPLRELFERNVSLTQWIATHGIAVDKTRLHIDGDWLTFDGDGALYKAMYNEMEEARCFKDFKTWLLDSMIEVLEADPLTSTIFSEEDKGIMKAGKVLTHGHFETFALAKIFKTKIHVISVNESDEPTERSCFGSEFEDSEVIPFFIKKSPLVVMMPPCYDESDLIFTDIEWLDSSDDEETEVLPDISGPVVNQEETVEERAVETDFHNDDNVTVDDETVEFNLDYVVTPDRDDERELIIAATNSGRDVYEQIEEGLDEILGGYKDTITEAHVLDEDQIDFDFGSEFLNDYRDINGKDM